MSVEYTKNGLYGMPTNDLQNRRAKLMGLYGWFGKTLRVNLSTGSIKEEAIEKNLLVTWLGGRGLGVYTIFHEVPPKCDPLEKTINWFLPAVPSPAPTFPVLDVLTYLQSLHLPVLFFLLMPVELWVSG